MNTYYRAFDDMPGLNQIAYLEYEGDRMYNTNFKGNVNKVSLHKIDKYDINKKTYSFKPVEETASSLMTINGVCGYLDENGTAQLRLEDVARGLGVLKRDIKNGKTYERIHATNIKKWLLEFGLMKSESNFPEFIPENIFYKLCFKAKNETARKFQDLVTDEILPTIRKTGIYKTNNSQSPISTHISPTTNHISEHDKIQKAKSLMRLANKYRSTDIAHILDSYAIMELTGKFIELPPVSKYARKGITDN